MMFLKYLIKSSDQTVVIKYDLRTNKLQIGGYFKFIELIHALTEKQYFGTVCELVNTHSQKNKIRYEGNISLKGFLEKLNIVKEDFDCEKVARVNRLL